jgi:type I restriction enzyme M protein
VKQRYATFKVKDIFEVRSGDFHAVGDLDLGDVALISCGDLNNGLVGRYDIPEEQQYRMAITVAYNGSWPLTTKYHPYAFGAKDDVAVLIPRQPMEQCVLIYVASLLNRLIWRYSYGRKCFKEKLQDVELVLPVRKTGASVEIDPFLPEQLFEKAYERVKNGAIESAHGLLSHAEAQVKGQPH